MFNLVSLLVAAALVSLQCSHEATARQIEDKKMDMDNSLKPNALPPLRRHVNNYVKIEPLPDSVRHVAGTTTILKCEVLGHPAPTVTWMRNGELVSDSEEDINEILNIHPTSSACFISKLVLTAPSNGDVYTCVATSSVVQKTSSTTVYTMEGEDPADVIEQLFNMPAEPIITEYYASFIQESGTRAVLPCRVSSYTKAQVYWQFNFNDITFDSPNVRILPSGDLLIPKLRWDSMGMYTCTAKNIYGTDSQSTFLYPLKPSKVD